MTLQPKHATRRLEGAPMSTASIARPTTHMSHLSAAAVEQFAITIAVARGLMSPPGVRPLCTLDPAVATELRDAARAALTPGRSWPDAELHARDVYAEFEFHRTFNCCTRGEQNAILQRVATIVHAARHYLAGDVEPLSDWRRAQVQPGAPHTDRRATLAVRDGVLVVDAEKAGV